MTTPNQFHNDRDKIIQPGQSTIKAPNLGVANNGQRVVVSQDGKPFWGFSPEEAINFAALLMKHASQVLQKKVEFIEDQKADYPDPEKNN